MHCLPCKAALVHSVPEPLSASRSFSCSDILYHDHSCYVPAAAGLTSHLTARCAAEMCWWVAHTPADIPCHLILTTARLSPPDELLDIGYRTDLLYSMGVD